MHYIFQMSTELISRVGRTDTMNLFVYIGFGTISLRYGDLGKAMTLTMSWFIADKGQSRSDAPLALKFTSTLIKSRSSWPAKMKCTQGSLFTQIFTQRSDPTLDRHKYTLFISADGDFKLQRKNKRSDPDDVSLSNGKAYFVADKPYRTYLKHVGVCHDVWYR